MKFPSVTTKEDFDLHFRKEIWRDAVEEICRRHKISFRSLRRAEQGEHIVFLIDERFVVKIYRPFRRCFEREKKALEFVGGRTNFRTPEIVETGKLENFDYILMTQMAGAAMTRADWLKLAKNEQLAFAAELAIGLKAIHSLDAESFVCDWREFVEDRAQTFIERQIAHGVNHKIIGALPDFIESNLKTVPVESATVFMHGDVHFGNLRLEKSGGSLRVSGLFDFADSRRAFYEYDFLAVGILMIQGQAEIQREFFRAYGYADSEMDEAMRRRLMMLTMLYESSDLRRYALRLKPEAIDYPLEKLGRAIWSFAEKKNV